jgi:hypothetical protein
LLLNVGLLQATLYDGNEEVIAIKMVTKVAKGAKKGEFVRTIFNPLE